MSKLVTVGLPNFNNVDYVEEAIESVLSQTYPHIRLVVVDDGSTDGSVELLRRLRERCGFELVEQENSGVSKALNRIVHEYAEGEYFAYMCSDDIMHKDRISKQVSFMESEESAGCIMCHADMTVINDAGDLGEDWICRNPLAPDLFTSFYKDETGISSPTTMFRLPEFKSLGGYDDRFLMEDYPTWLKLSQVSKFGYIPESLVLYRRHDSNLSGNQFRNLKFVDEVMEEYVDVSPECRKILHNKRYWLVNHFIEAERNLEAASYFLEKCRMSRFRSLDSMKEFFELKRKLKSISDPS